MIGVSISTPEEDIAFDLKSQRPRTRKHAAQDMEPSCMPRRGCECPVQPKRESVSAVLLICELSEGLGEKGDDIGSFVGVKNGRYERVVSKSNVSGSRRLKLYGRVSFRRQSSL